MTKTFISRLAALAFVGAAVTAMAPAAKADMVFHNATGVPLHFEMTCTGDGGDAWTLAPHDSRSLYCTNGSHVAEVKIRTDHGSYETVVRRLVWDGSVYDLTYDSEGDVNIFRA